MSLVDHVRITITRDTLGVRRLGFGTALLLSANATWGPELTRTYEDLAGVGEDFGTDQPEYLAAQAIFSQDPHPRSIKIGRSTLKPTKRYTLAVANIRSEHDYVITVDGDGVTPTDVTFTSDDTATNDEIIAGLVAALNLVTGKNFTAAVVAGGGDTDTATITGDAAGDWFSIQVNHSDLLVEENHADPGVVTDLDAIEQEDSDWYAIYTFYNSKAYAGAVSAWVEARTKIYALETNTSEVVTAAVGGADEILEDSLDFAYDRTIPIWHDKPTEMYGAALLGSRLPYDPGSETWKYAQPVGISAASLSATHRTNLRARNANFYEVTAGRGINVDGKVSSGEWIDIIRGLDWLEDDMSRAVYDALTSVPKVPYSNDGIAQIESVMRGSLARGERRGLLDSGWDTQVPEDVEDIDEQDRADRILPDMKFSARMAGAIHEVEIDGVVSV